MKKLLKSSLLLLLLLSLALLAFTACDGDKPEETETESESETEETIYALEMSADKTTVKRGDTVTLSAVLRAEGAEDIPSEGTRYQITYGAEYATIQGNTVTVLNTANHGQTIRVRAQEGATFSPELTITVSVPAESIELDANGVTSVMPGAITLLNASILPAGACDDIEWLVDGKATVTGGVLAVNAQAKTGETVKVKAKIGDEVSNELVFTVGIPVMGFEIAIDELNDLLENDVHNVADFVKLTAASVPENATNGGYEWVATQNGEHVRFDGDKMILLDTAVTGMIIKVKAVAKADETITSEEELTFTVGYPIEKLSANVTGGSANVNNGQSVTLSVAPTPSFTTNGSYEWVFITENWEECVTLNGDVLTVKEGVPFGTEIKLRAVSKVDETITSNVITIVVGIPIDKIDIAAPSAPAILDREGRYELTLDVWPENAGTSTVEWEFTGENAEYAKVENGYLVIDKGAIAGKSITVTAKSGDVVSKQTLTFTIGVALDDITIELVGSANVDPDGTRVVIPTLIPSNASDTEIEWVKEKNGKCFDIVNGMLVIKSNAPIGTIIEFYAKIGDVTSDSIKVTVGTPITTIEIEASGSTSIVKGNAADISVTLDPPTASKDLLRWIVLDEEGKECSYARVIGNTLFIYANAPTGAKIFVKAIYQAIDETITSNELVFIAKATPEEEANALKYFIDLSSDTITLDKNGGGFPTLLVTVVDGNGKTVTDKELAYEFVDGEKYLGLKANGMLCDFEARGHGTATVKVSVAGTSYSETFTVKVIVPPDSVKLPEVFLERTDIEYHFSLKDPKTNAPEILPFRPTVNAQNTLACKDYTVEFYNETTGASGDEVAIYDYANGTVTFKQTGKVVVTVSSASGSKTKVETRYTFRINDGYNVSTYEELKSIVGAQKKVTVGGSEYWVSAYNGEEINFVVTEKPVGADGYDKYGYDIVPAVALKAKDEQTISEILNVRVQAVNTGLYINGNNHKIDVSQLRTFTKDEYLAYRLETHGKDEATIKEEGSYIPNVSSLLSAEPYMSGSYSQEAGEQYVYNKQYQIKLYNLVVIGNASVSYDPANYSNTTDFVGAIHKGIAIGHKVYNNVHYYIDADALTASGFAVGISIDNAVDSVAKNLTAGNCYSTGIACRSSIITLDGLTFGKCGATGLELAPEFCDKAGLNSDQDQTVTIIGDIDAAANTNNGQTNYFNNYPAISVPGVPTQTVMQLVNSNVGSYCSGTDGQKDPSKLSHLQDANGEFIFVSLIFNDLTTGDTNTSQVKYDGELSGDAIDITAIGLGEGNVDTTHQFIMMNIELVPGSQFYVGKALFLNLNYKAQATVEE